MNPIFGAGKEFGSYPFDLTLTARTRLRLRSLISISAEVSPLYLIGNVVLSPGFRPPDIYLTATSLGGIYAYGVTTDYARVVASGSARPRGLGIPFKRRRL